MEATANGIDYGTAYDRITTEWVGPTYGPGHVLLTIGHFEYRYRGGALTPVVPTTSSVGTFTYGPGSAYGHTNVDAAIKADGNVTINNVNVNVYNPWSPPGKRRAGIIVAANVTQTGGQISAIGTDTAGVRIDSGKLDTTATFTASGDKSSGIYLKGGDVTTHGSTFTVSGDKAHGINSNAGTAVETNDGSFNITGSEANGIYAKAGTVKSVGTDFTISANKNTGIYSTSNVSSTTVHGPSSLVKIDNGVTGANGLYIDKGSLDVDNVTFEVNKNRNAGIADDKNAAIHLTKNAQGDADVKNSTITVHGTESAGIWADAHSSAKIKPYNTSFFVGNITLKHKVT